MDVRSLLMGCAVGLLFAAPAFAQDDQNQQDQGGMGLDLTGEQGMGLDLSEPEVPAELKPSIAIVGVSPAQEDAILKARAEAVEKSLVATVNGQNAFSKIVPPEEVATALEPDTATLRQCAAAECLEKIADKLDVDRVVIGQLSFAEGETKVTLTGYDRGKKAVTTATAESAEKAMRRQLSGFAGISGKSQATKDKEFLARANPACFDIVSGLKTALGTINVRSYEPDVEVTLNGKKAGVGAFTKTLPAGEYAVHAESPNVLPFDTRITVEPLKTTEVALELVAKPRQRAPVAATEKVTAPIYTRPGCYVAIAGAVAVGVGAALGSSAQAVGTRGQDADGDGIYEVTRAEMLSAKTNATVANVLMGVGGAAIVGGTVWMFVAPGTAKASSSSGPEEPEGSGGGFTIGVRGQF